MIKNKAFYSNGRGTELTLAIDNFPENPLNEERLGVVAAFYSNYNHLGEVDSIVDILLDLELTEARYDYLASTDNLLEVMAELEKQGSVAIPLYLAVNPRFELTLEPSMDLKSFLMGFNYASKQTLKQEYGWERVTQKRRDLVKEKLRAESKIYAQYLRGDIFQYTLKEPGNRIVSKSNLYSFEELWNGVVTDPEILTELKANFVATA